MPRSFDPTDGWQTARVKDIFEVRPDAMAPHEPGLVVVLDRVVSANPCSLIGKVACVRNQADDAVERRIDKAKDHIACTSLFFQNMTVADVRIGAEVTILDHTANGSSATQAHEAAQ